MYLDLGGMEHQGRRAVITPMRLHGCWAPLVAGVAALGVAGCGTSAPVIKPTVNVAITAPTNGATVGVRDLTVTGTVTPATAQVLVAGQPATVQAGSFRRTLRLDGSAQTVTVTAQAAGYAPAQANTQVSYSARLAAQLAAASRTLAAPGPSAAASLSAASPPASASLLAQAVALPKPAPAARHTTPAKRTRPTTTHSSSSASAPSASTPTASTPAPRRRPRPPRRRARPPRRRARLRLRSPPRRRHRSRPRRPRSPPASSSSGRATACRSSTGARRSRTAPASTPTWSGRARSRRPPRSRRSSYGSTVTSAPVTPHTSRGRSCGR